MEYTIGEIQREEALLNIRGGRRAGIKTVSGRPSEERKTAAMNDFSFSIASGEELLDLRLYQYGWEQCAPLHSFGPFVRNHFLFHYIISGKGSLDAGLPDGGAQTFRLRAGQGFLISPGQINTYSADRDEPWKYVWLEFDGLKAAGYMDAAGLSAAQPVYRSNNAALAESLRDAMLYIASHPKSSTLHQIGHLCIFLDALIQSSATRREAQGQRLRDFYIHEAVAFVEENYQRALSVEEIAGVCKLDRSYFSKLFKAEKGCSPQEYLIRTRLSKAAEMMKSSSASIGDIAAACGYPNQLHFSRSFKRHYGVSPREWRGKNKLYKRD